MTSEPFRITQSVFTELPVRGGTHWYFLELSNADGVTGLAEFSYGVNSMAVARAIAQMVEELQEEEITDETEIPAMVGLSPSFLQSDRVLAAAITAIRNAGERPTIAGISVSSVISSSWSSSTIWATARATAMELSP